MQLFHKQLFQSSEGIDPAMHGLAQLTLADRSRLDALETALDWLPWT
jgi:hypothetical protein